MRLQELGINKGQVMAISKEEESDEEVLLVKMRLKRCMF